MKRLSFAVTISLALLLLPGAAWAQQGSQSGFHSGHARVFVHHGHNHSFDPRHHFFVHHGFIHPHHFGPTFVVVDQAPHWVWVPGVWHWNGFQWVWVPGRWTW